MYLKILSPVSNNITYDEITNPRLVQTWFVRMGNATYVILKASVTLSYQYGVCMGNILTENPYNKTWGEGYPVHHQAMNCDLFFR